MAYWPEDNQSTLKGNEFDKRCHEVFIDDIANKGPFRQGYGFSSSHVWM